MNREEKVQLVNDIRQNLTNSKFVSIVHYDGICDKDLYNIRTELKSKDCNIKIAKNNLVKIAIKDTDLNILDSHLTGPTALLYSNDPVALAKVITDKLKEVKNLKLITGYMDSTLIEESKIKDLSKLGSIEEVRSGFIGKLKAVPTSIVFNMVFHQSNLISLLDNYSKNKKD